MIEIKIIGRGGQGAVTTAYLLAKAAFYDKFERGKDRSGDLAKSKTWLDKWSREGFGQGGQQQNQNANRNLTPPASTPTPAPPQKITTIDSPLSNVAAPYPIYNLYPPTPIVATLPTQGIPTQNGDDTAFNPGLVFHPYDAAYYGLSGYPPVVMWPPTNIDKVKGVEDKF